MTSLMTIAMKMTLHYDTDDDNTIMTRSEFDGEHDDGTTILLIIDKR